MADTAWNDGHRVLYHWQGFNEERRALFALLHMP